MPCVILSGHASVTFLKLSCSGDYTFKNLPPFLHSLNGIKTSNEDAQSPETDDSWLCFTVEEPARVYIMYDPRLTKQGAAAWLKVLYQLGPRAPFMIQPLVELYRGCMAVLKVS
jgi:hypothetical protein